jgi:hypothetical protein
LVENLQQIKKINSEVSFDLKMYYRLSNSNSKKLQNFKEKKKKFLDLHELITRIAYKITIDSENVISLIDSFFFQDILEYVIFINETPKIIEDASKGLKKSQEIIKRLITSIIENSLRIIYNGLNADLDETSGKILKSVNFFFNFFLIILI